MHQDDQSGTAARAVKVLYTSLFTGQAVLGLTFAVIVRLNGPLIANAPFIGRVQAGIGFLVLVVAMVVLRPRVALRTADVQPAVFWANPTTQSAVQLVWFLAEGAAILAWIGYLLTGLGITVIVALAAMASFARVRPSYFEANRTA